MVWTKSLFANFQTSFEQRLRIGKTTQGSVQIAKVIQISSDQRMACAKCFLLYGQLSL
jgi:hypothetical protein